VKVLVDEVHIGSQEQSKGIDQVSRALTQMQQMTTQTAANAEQTASAGQELDSYANALNKIVRDLDRLVGSDAETKTRSEGTGTRIRSALRVLSGPVETPRKASEQVPAFQFAQGGRNSMDDDFKEF